MLDSKNHNNVRDEKVQKMEEITNLLWIIVAGKASSGHAGTVVENQSLDFVTHLVTESLVIVEGKLSRKIQTMLSGNS